MEYIQKLVDWLLPYQEYSFALVFGILIGCGFGLPIPEDIVLVAGGIMSGLTAGDAHMAEFWWMLLVSMGGVLAGDSTMYMLGRIFGYKIQKFKPMRTILSPKRFAQIQKLFKRYGIGVLFVARFLPVLRSPTFLVAGMSRRVGFIKFIAMDGFAALISVPVWVSIGHFGAQNREQLADWLSNSKNGFLVLTIVLVLGLAMFIWHHKRKEKLKKLMDGTSSEKKTDSK